LSEEERLRKARTLLPSTSRYCLLQCCKLKERPNPIKFELPADAVKGRSRLYLRRRLRSSFSRTWIAVSVNWI
jgi:hypothetical protein